MKPKLKSNARTSNAELTAQTRFNILDATITSLASVGYAGTTISSIAEKVGISRPALVYHFESKYALLVETANALYDYMGVEFTQAAPPSLPPRERVLALMDASFRMTSTREQRALIELLLAAQRDPEYKTIAGPAIEVRDRRFAEAWQSIIDSVDCPPEGVNLVRDLIISAHRGMTIGTSLHGDAEAPNWFEQHAALRRLMVEAMTTRPGKRGK